MKIPVARIEKAAKAVAQATEPAFRFLSVFELEDGTFEEIATRRIVSPEEMAAVDEGGLIIICPRPPMDLDGNAAGNETSGAAQSLNS